MGAVAGRWQAARPTSTSPLAATFDTPPGLGWLYVAALRRFTGRLLDGLTQRLRAGAHTAKVKEAKG